MRDIGHQLVSRKALKLAPLCWFAVFWPVVVGGTANNCRALADLKQPASSTQWVVVSDELVGGRSEAHVEHAEGVLRFAGLLSHENDSFVAIRLALEPGAVVDTDTLDITVRGNRDEVDIWFATPLRYRNRLITYQVTAEGLDEDAWTTVHVPYADLVPRVDGNQVRAPVFAPSKATGLYFVMTDNRSGDFMIDVADISACHQQ